MRIRRVDGGRLETVSTGQDGSRVAATQLHSAHVRLGVKLSLPVKPCGHLHRRPRCSDGLTENALGVGCKDPWRARRCRRAQGACVRRYREHVPRGLSMGPPGATPVRCCSCSSSSGLSGSTSALSWLVESGCCGMPTRSCWKALPRNVRSTGGTASAGCCDRLRRLRVRGVRGRVPSGGSCRWP